MSISRSASSHLSIPPPSVTPIAPPDESEIVGSSAAMNRLRLQVQRIGPHFRTVLVSGEAGTGKELVARALHNMSPVAEGPFVVCDAGTLECALAEYEGSTPSNRGTLFLDGVGAMPLEVQDRLLKALRKYDSTHKADLRMIASTSEDMRILVSTGRFRHELYQRLATVDITLPPLRDRLEDLPELARCFLKRFALFYGRGVCEIANGAMARMQEYRWPGNLLELESMLRNSMLRTEGDVIEAHRLPMFGEAAGHDQSMSRASGCRRLQDVVEQHVLRVLKDCGGNKVRAAEELGISRSTLYRMLDASARTGTVR